VTKGREPRPARITIRLPLRLYEALLPIANEDHRWVSEWIAVTLQHAIDTYDPSQSTPVVVDKRRGTQVTTRIQVGVSLALREALRTVAGQDARSISQWVTVVLEKAVSDRKV